MNILLTGHNGFVGKHLLSFLNIKYKVSTVSRQETDLKDTLKVKDLVNSINPDVIIHFAATASPVVNKDKINDILENNILSTHNLLNYAPEGCKFIFASSIFVYGPCSTERNESGPTLPNNVYGISKLTCENLVNMYTREGKIRGVSLRFPGIVGPNMSHGLLYDFLKRSENSNVFTIFGTKPGSNRPYIHVRDCINIVDYFVNNAYYGNYNAVSQGQVSAETIAQKICEIKNKQMDIVFSNQNSNFNSSYNVDGTLLKNSGYKWYYNSSLEAIEQAIHDNTN